MKASKKATKTFTDFVKEGFPYDNFEGFKVLNPQLANSWEILQASYNSKFQQWYQPLSAGFRNEIEVTTVFLTDGDFVEVIDQLEAAAQ